MANLHQTKLKVCEMGEPVGNTADMVNPTYKCGAQQLFAANMRRIRLLQKLTQEKVAEAAELRELHQFGGTRRTQYLYLQHRADRRCIERLYG